MLKPNLTHIALTCTVFLAMGENRSAAQNLADLHRITGGVSTSHVEYHRVKLAPGMEYVLADLRGPGRITYFYFTDDTGGKLYPGLVVKVFWDDEQEPSIEMPLADFFGAIGGKTIDYQSTPMQINHYCYMCYLPMPFSRRARLVLINDGDRDYSQNVAYGVDGEHDTALAGEKSRLHALWHRSNPTENSMHILLEAQGRGHYIGNFLQVHSKYSGWWGEGDTIFHIDGQAMTHTPGTEDGALYYLGCPYDGIRANTHRPLGKVPCMRSLIQGRFIAILVRSSFADRVSDMWWPRTCCRETKSAH